jgi:putative DNA primase/helicase
VVAGRDVERWAVAFARRLLGEDEARVLFRELGNDSGGYYARAHVPRTDRPSENIADPKIIDKIERTWAATLDDDGTAARYLRTRGLSGAVPSALRLHPSLAYWQPGSDGTTTLVGKYPAIVAEVRMLDGTVAALHRTYLAPGGHGKAEVPEPKKLTPAIFSGATKGAAIHLAEPTDGRLAITEGIETGLAVMEATDTPTWACVCEGGLRTVVLPPDIRAVDVWADHDRRRGTRGG